MQEASIDFETRSTTDLTKVGAHKYAEHPTTKVMCMAWVIGNEEAQLWWPWHPFPARLRQHILAGGILNAWNAQFERLIWPIMERDHDAPPAPLEQWRCTMVRAFLMGFPGKLEHAGPSMGLGACKDAAGHRVMLQVSKPRNVFRSGDKGYKEAMLDAEAVEGAYLPEFEYFLEEGKLCVAQWWVDNNRMGVLGEYCLKDVVVERAAGYFLDPINDYELAGWQLDQRINDRGFYVDMTLVQKAKALMTPATKVATRELQKLTGDLNISVTKPNDIRAWLNVRLGLELDSISKDVLELLLIEHPLLAGENPADPVAVEVVKLRLSAAKTSTAKLNSLLRTVNWADLVRGGLQYAGAGRTNRWAGRGFQPHNIPRPPKWAPLAVPYVLAGKLLHIKFLFGPALEAISAILRSCITARPGNELTVADYNAIESRFTAWLAGDEEILAAYRRGDDVYRIMAAKVFGVADWRSINKESMERFLGKALVLGCGFGMGWRKFWESCRKDGLFIEKDLAQTAVATYRKTPDGEKRPIPLAWDALETAAVQAVQSPGQWFMALDGKIGFYKDTNFLRMRLPSGRYLSYLAPRLEETVTPWGSPTFKLWFWGWNGQKNRMEWQSLYGGRIMENAAQAGSRDVLLDAMLRLDSAGWGIVLTVHDELLTDNPKGTKHLADMLQLMGVTPPWAEGLPLKAEGWQGHRYRK